MECANQRSAYGAALAELAGKNTNVVALDADLCNSTMSVMLQKEFPDRFFEMGIAEASMASTAAGLSLTGKIPFIHSFAVFSAGRAYDQIRQTICIGNLNVKVCGSSAGLSDFGDGSTHQAIEDVNLMRALPNMTVLCPVDAAQTAKAVQAAAEKQGPVYIRICRNDIPVLTSENDSFAIGDVYTMREGTDVVIFAMGVMVSKALEAADTLAKEGISAKVVNVPTIKPINTQQVIDAVKGAKAVVTAEEHSVIGGLGSTIAEVLRKEKLPMDFVGVQDKFGTSAMDYPELLERYNLTAEEIAKTVKGVL